MNTRTVSVFGGLVLLAVTALAGCGPDLIAAEPSAAAGSGGEDVLKVRVDTARNRRWVLGVNDLRVYDAAKSTLVRRIALPNWSVARSVCLPDLVLDRAGTAYIASNVQPKLWRVDAGRFEVSEHEIRLQGKEGWDMGFGAVAFTPSGALYALTSAANSAWKIDLAKGSASPIEFYNPPTQPCGLTREFLSRMEKIGGMQKTVPVAASAG